jgi:hypothetical protein
MALRPESWLDKKLLPLDQWDPVMVHQPTPLSISSSSRDVDTLHGYKSSMLTTLTKVLNDSSNGRNEWHEPLFFIIIDYIIPFPLPLIGRHIMTLEHASARGEPRDEQEVSDVTFHNGYYYAGTWQGNIVVSCFEHPVLRYIFFY